MDGSYNSYDSYEGSVKRKRTNRPPTRTVPCRGRGHRRVKNTRTSFRECDLDQAAPLSAHDIWQLSHKTNPPYSVQMHIAARIACAQYLKYGA